MKTLWKLAASPFHSPSQEPLEFDHNIISPGPLNWAERTYLLDWLFKFSANTSPTTILKGDLRNVAGTAIDYTKVAAFVGTSTNYKLYNRLQIRYVPGPNGNFAGAPVVLQQATSIGTTASPLTLPPPLPAFFPGQKGPANSAAASVVHNNRVSSIVDGSPDKDGVEVFNTLTKFIGTTPVYWGDIGDKITFHSAGTLGYYTDPDFTPADYPSFYVYLNGRLDIRYYSRQAATPLAHFVKNPYPWGPGGGSDLAQAGLPPPAAPSPLYTAP